MTRCYICDTSEYENHNVNIKLRNHGGRKEYLCDECDNSIQSQMDDYRKKDAEKFEAGETPYQLSLWEEQ